MKRREYVKVVGSTSVVGVAGCVLEPPEYRSTEASGQDAPSPTPNEELPISDQEVAAIGTDVQESVVKFDTGGGPGGLGGTGWFVDERTVVTNAHVAQKLPPDARVETYGGTTLEMEPLGAVESMDPDVGALTVTPPDDPDYTPLATGETSSLEPGDPMVQVGHPGSIGYWVVSVGGFTQKREGVGWLLSTVPTLRGNSGSPVVDADGNVVGLTTGETWLEEMTDYREDPQVFRAFDPPTRTTHVPVEIVTDRLSEWR